MWGGEKRAGPTNPATWLAPWWTSEVHLLTALDTSFFHSQKHVSKGISSLKFLLPMFVCFWNSIWGIKNLLTHYSYHFYFLRIILTSLFLSWPNPIVEKYYWRMVFSLILCLYRNKKIVAITIWITQKKKGLLETSMWLKHN